jgi:alpha-amylase/alpha-mannosidase (GH57 family)
MPKIYLCFLWHMHQPFYKDLVSGEYRLPWTRMHALKDYYGMAKILEDFPGIRQTFNLVPSMIVQVDEYARGVARDPFLACALKPAEDLTPEEQAFILRNFFMAHPVRMIERYPRYGELFAAHRANAAFATQDFRDLQVLSQLAWFDEEFQEHDPAVRALIEKGRGFTLADQALMGAKQREICARVIPEYRKLAAAGQIEISTTPFYHPILPLLCDSDIASVAHPHMALPRRFSYPEDARLQLDMARDYIEATFGISPAGLWPSEGSVSDHVLEIASTAGFKWAATDNGVLGQTLRREATPEITYRPYLWSQRDREIRMIFRDHVLSDLIGFVYSGMGAEGAAQDFLHRIHDNCRPVLASGRDALVPIILDGENAWEYYDRNGRPFFRELYKRIQHDGSMEAITVSEALRRIPPDPLTHIFPGSWINANFDIWIGAEEDNTSWRLLLDAREAVDQAERATPAQKREAMEEIMIAEGSDWNWWYGPEHESANAIEFDQLYREHLSNVYRSLGIPTPPELSRPILQSAGDQSNVGGIYKVDQRSGSMHGKRPLVKEVHYGIDAGAIALRIDFGEDSNLIEGLELQAEMPDTDGKPETKLRVKLEGTGVLEIRLPRSAHTDRLRLSFWRDGLPIQAIPPQDYLVIPPAN